MKTKLLIVLGPTASGKSDLAVKLAEKFDGEIISADSRQVYRGLDIGTGKITKEEMCGIEHYCLDIADPRDSLTVVDWLKSAESAIDTITKKNKLPIVCGGTGFYISTLLEGDRFPKVSNDTKERDILEQKTAEELFSELKKLDPARALTIDPNNKRRLSRAILIARELGAVPPIDTEIGSRYDSLKIGIEIPDDVLRERIKTRIIKRIEIGMIEEAEQLHTKGLPFERMDELGLEYRYLAQYIQGKTNKEELIDILSTKIWQYARRQKTWWRKDDEIKWININSDMDELNKIIISFLG